MTSEKQNKIIPVCASLVMHLLLAIIFVWSLSCYKNSSSDFDKKMNLVWVSLETKSIFAPYQAAQKNEQPQQFSSGNNRGLQMLAPTESLRPEMEMKKEVPAISLYGGGAVSEKQKITAPVATEEKYISSGSGREASPAGAIPAFSNAYPLYRENAPPGYPEIARLRGYEGVVLVAAEILPDGRVGGTRISRSSGYAILDQTAIEAVKPWKFEPAKKSGKPYKMWVELPIKFVLHDENQQS
jgi:protein TonB